MSIMLTIAELRTIAQELGLTGTAATEFIYQQQELMRNERAADRELQKAQIDVN